MHKEDNSHCFIFLALCLCQTYVRVKTLEPHTESNHEISQISLSYQDKLLQTGKRIFAFLQMSYLPLPKFHVHIINPVYHMIFMHDLHSQADNVWYKIWQFLL